MDRLTPGQARTLAAFVGSLRPDWGRPGIEAALEKARPVAAAGDVAVAAIRAAQSPGNTTPAVIALDGPHWATSTGMAYFPPAPSHERCSICGEPEARCIRIWSGDDQPVTSGKHTFDPDTRPDHGIDTTRTVQALRGEVAPPPTPIEPKSLDEFLPAPEPAQEASA